MSSTEKATAKREDGAGVGRARRPLRKSGLSGGKCASVCYSLEKTQGCCAPRGTEPAWAVPCRVTRFDSKTSKPAEVRRAEKFRPTWVRSCRDVIQNDEKSSMRFCWAEARWSR